MESAAQNVTLPNFHIDIPGTVCIALMDETIFFLCYNHQMDIKERLQTLKKWELENLARNLKATGYSKLNKQTLIEHIKANYTEQEIKAITDAKLTGLRKIKNPLLILIGVLGGIASIIGVILFLSDKGDIAKEKKINEYYHNLLERQELRMRGHPIDYINGLGENPLLKHHLEKGQELSKESRFKQAIKEFKKCLSHPKALISNKVAAHILIGNCYYELSRIKESESHYNIALKLSGKVNDKDESLRGKSAAFGNIGLIYSNLGKPDEALKYIKDALAIYRKIGYEQGIAICFSNIGLIYSKLGKIDEALKYLKNALAIHKKIGYEKGIANQLFNIGLIYCSLGKQNEALKYLEDAFAIHRKIGYEQGIANQLCNIGLIYIDLGKPYEALKYLNEALSIHRKIGYEKGIASDLGNIGMIYFSLDKLEEALKYLKESLEIFKRIGAIQQVETTSRAIEIIEKIQK